MSFANCGLPYFVGDVIKDEKDLIVASPQKFKERFNIDVCVRHTVHAIDRDRREIEVENLETGERRRERYTHLVLSPGAEALRPPLPGIDLSGIFVLRTIPDSRMIRTWIDAKQAGRAVVLGGGFIGLEMAENLVHRGLQVTLVERNPQVMPPLDLEMAATIKDHLTEKGIHLHLDDGVAAFENDDDGLQVITRSGERLPADLVILSIGVRPRTELAAACGLTLGERGGIRVDASMRTNDPFIFAVGDAIETTDVVTGHAVVMPLAGPANRQGRIAADAIFDRDKTFRGVQGTAVCGVFDLTVAMTGASEKTLKRLGVTDYEKIYLHPGHHVGYYPGAQHIHLKLIYRPSDGRILGAQAVGKEGVARRIDVIATAIQMGATVEDLSEVELCYAPQFGAAKDPVNLAGMIASNARRGDLPLAHWPDLDLDAVLLMDVREADEFAASHVPGAVNFPLSTLRQRLGEIPTEREIWIYCGVGQRAYYATRALMQTGHRVRNLSGGITTWRQFQLAGQKP